MSAIFEFDFPICRGCSTRRECWRCDKLGDWIRDRMEPESGDLISRAALLEAMELVYDAMNRQYVDIYALGRIAGFKSAIKAVEDAPAVDAEPVRHGYWIDDRMDVVCSACGTRFKDSIDFIQGADGGRPKRCPECGAKMDEQKAGE